jgi:hypothetical protein
MNKTFQKISLVLIMDTLKKKIFNAPQSPDVAFIRKQNHLLFSSQWVYKTYDGVHVGRVKWVH